jgi:hypothetical protein
MTEEAFCHFNDAFPDGDFFTTDIYSEGGSFAGHAHRISKARIHHGDIHRICLFLSRQQVRQVEGSGCEDRLDIFSEPSFDHEY